MHNMHLLSHWTLSAISISLKQKTQLGCTILGVMGSHTIQDNDTTTYESFEDLHDAERKSGMLRTLLLVNHINSSED